MCITYCFKKAVLYDNHRDCQPVDCAFAGEVHGRCVTCRHQQEASCALTQAPLPAAGGCCHWNIEPVSGPLVVSRAMLAPLQLTIDESEVGLLKDFGVPYHWSEIGELLIDLADLSLPITYGLGTELVEDDEWEELE